MTIEVILRAAYDQAIEESRHVPVSHAAERALTRRIQALVAGAERELGFHLVRVRLSNLVTTTEAIFVVEIPMCPKRSESLMAAREEETRLQGDKANG